MIDIINKFQGDKKKILAGAIILALILYIDFSFILKSQFSMLKIINPKIAQLKKDIKKLNNDLATLAVTKKSKEETQETVVKTTEKIIKEERIPKVLGDIDKIANKWGVKIMKISPSLSSSAKSEVSTSTTVFFPFFITLDISGPYHSIGKFINDLEDGSVLMAVDELRIEFNTMDYMNQEVSLILKTYVKK